MKQKLNQLTSNKDVIGKTIKEVINCNPIAIFICDDNTYFIVDGLRVYDAFDYMVGITTQTPHDLLGDYQPIPTLPSKIQSILLNKIGYENV